MDQPSDKSDHHLPPLGSHDEESLDEPLDGDGDGLEPVNEMDVVREIVGEGGGDGDDDEGEEEGEENVDQTPEGAQLRDATDQYLRGELSLPEYAAVLNMFNQRDARSKSSQQEAEPMEVEGLQTGGVDATSGGTGTVVLPGSRIYEGEYFDNEGNIIRVESTDITDSLFTYKSKSGSSSRGSSQSQSYSQESSELSTSSVGTGPGDINLGFYQSGTDLKSFTMRRKRKLSPTIQNLIGQSHLSYAQGNWKAAIEICLEIIKEQPTCIEPFHTLSMIYENLGRMDKCLQYALVAGLLDPRHCEEWPKLADLSLQEGNLQQAIMCFSYASMVNPRNYEYQLRRCELQEKVQDYKAALKGYQKILQNFPNEGRLCVEVLRKSAAIHHESENLDDAFHSLEIGFDHHSEFITSEEVNLMLELCLTLKKYVYSLKILIKYCHVRFSPPLDPDRLPERRALTGVLKEIECIIPQGFNIDLTAKLVIVLVHLDAFHISDRLCGAIFNYGVEEFGDIYFDIAEAYIGKRKPAFALTLLTPLVGSTNYSLAAVWLRYAECLYTVERREEAVNAYQKVVQLAPTHDRARVNLAVLLHRMKRTNEALDVLGDVNWNEDCFIYPPLLIERCHILFDNGRIAEFIDRCMRLLTRHFPLITSGEDFPVLVMVSNRGKRYEALRTDRQIRGEQVATEYSLVQEDTNIFSEWKLYLRLCHTLFQLGRHDLLSRAAHSAMGSRLFGNFKQNERDAEIHCYVATILSNDPHHLLPHYIRMFMPSIVNNFTMLNLFGLAIRKGNPKRYGRHLLRLLKKYPGRAHILLLRAHISFATYSYKNAICEYSKLFGITPKNPLIWLMMASAYLHLMVQKASTMNRARISMMIVSLMNKYAEMRGNCQESLFNLGRTYHILGFNRMAIRYYRKVLETPPVMQEPRFRTIQYASDGNRLDQACNPDPAGSILDLKYEAAFNLSQLYRSKGQDAIANTYLMNYIVI